MLGVLGIANIPRPKLFGLELIDNLQFLVFVAVCAFSALSILYIYFNSSSGRAMRARAEDPAALMALGHNVNSIANCAFIVSSSFAGLAGSLFAYYLSYIDPTSFSMSETVFILSATVLGRPGSFWGNIAATIFLVLLPESFRFLSIVSAAPGA